MNQELMKRLFRSIEGDRSDDIVKVAFNIIDDERIKGHIKLADQLNTLLEKNLIQNESFKGELKRILPQGVSVPTDKRYNLPLATPVGREALRHEMILPNAVETKIHRIEQEYVGRERLAKFGLQPRKKILFYGAPGCGKSMSAERIAWNIGLLDEFDIIAKARDYGQDVGEMNRIVNILLTLLEEYDAPGLLIATTNLEGILDKALFRRFDDLIEIPKPGQVEITKLLKTTLSAIKTKGVKWEKMASQMQGFSAALVVKIANDAAKLVVINNRQELTQIDLEQALSETKLYQS